MVTVMIDRPPPCVRRRRSGFLENTRISTDGSAAVSKNWLSPLLASAYLDLQLRSPSVVSRHFVSASRAVARVATTTERGQQLTAGASIAIRTAAVVVN